MKKSFQKQFFVKWTVSLRVYETVLLDWLIDLNRSQMVVDSLIEQVENLDFVRFL